MNSTRAVSVGVFNSMFIMMPGNFLKTSSSLGIFYLLDLTRKLTAKSKIISSMKFGKSS